MLPSPSTAVTLTPGRWAAIQAAYSSPGPGRSQPKTTATWMFDDRTRAANSAASATSQGKSAWSPAPGMQPRSVGQLRFAADDRDRDRRALSPQRQGDLESGEPAPDDNRATGHMTSPV